MKIIGSKGAFLGKRGFTLIELLVVVLIIGILAAVALPQYQKAVKKARFRNMQQIAETIATAEEVYYLTHGAYTRQLNALDVSIEVSEVPNLSLRETFCASGLGKIEMVIYFNNADLPAAYKGRRECRVYDGGAAYFHDICKEVSGGATGAYISSAQYTTYIFK